jgi:four helix bundle protein
MTYSYEKLDVYKLSMAFAYDVYQTVSSFPDYEKFGLSSQLRRAVISFLQIAQKVQEGNTKRNMPSFSFSPKAPSGRS